MQEPSAITHAQIRRMAKMPRTEARVADFYETVIVHLEEEEATDRQRRITPMKTKTGRGKSPYNAFVSRYLKAHKGATIADAARAWRGRGSPAYRLSAGSAANDNAIARRGSARKKRTKKGRASKSGSAPKRKKPRSAAQKAATAQMLAANRKKRGRKSRKSARRIPAARKTSHRKGGRRKKSCHHCGATVPPHAGSAACRSCGRPHTLRQHWSHAKGKGFAKNFEHKRLGTRVTKVERKHTTKASLQRLRCQAICRKYRRR